MKQTLLLFSALLLASPATQAQWVNQPIALPAPASNLVFQLSVVDANTVWTTVYDADEGEYTQRFCRTTNGGTNWTVGRVPGLTPNDFVTSIFGVSASTAWATIAPSFPVTGGRLLKTTDGGTTWTAPTSGGQFSNNRSFPFLIRFFDANNGVAVGEPISNTSNFEIFTTADGGTTWTQVVQGTLPALLPNEQSNGALALVAQNGSSIWFGTDEGRVFRSTDRGFTWAVSSTGLTEFTTGLAFRNATTGLVVDEDGNVARTSNGGLTWNRITPAGPLHVVGLDNVPGTANFVSTGLTGEVGGAGSSYSTNDGQTWTAIESRIDHTFVDFVSPNTGWSGGIAFDANDDALGNGINKYTGVALATNAGLVARLGVSSFPNPSLDGRFTIQATSLTAPATARVLDELGRTVLQQAWRSPQTAPLQLNLSGRLPGVYVLELSTPDGPVRQKLVVQ